MGQMEGMLEDVTNFLSSSYFYALYTHCDQNFRIRFDSDYAQTGAQRYALLSFVSTEGN